ncbi:MAG: PKD domain-containing protein, partial [Candidatus Lutacidiplasmatales archaeon]
SNGVLELVGGASFGFCTNASSIVTTFVPSPAARDVPGDFQFAPTVAGGSPPYTIQYTNDDPYARLCGCGIFRTPGTHQVTAFVNDSGNHQAVVSANVTLYPVLSGTFGVTAVSGPAPLSTGFTMTVAGGHGANTSGWQFGDGQSVSTPNANHTYTTPGYYVAVGRANDSYGGNASQAYLIDVTNASAAPPVVVTAVVGPAVAVSVGDPVTFRATVTNGSAGPYSVAWSFAPSGFSAYGPSVTETFPYLGCLTVGSCPLFANLTVRSGDGTTVAVVPIRLDGAESGNSSALTFTSRLSPTTGDAPFVVFGTASASGLPGVGLHWDFGDGGSQQGSPVTHVYLTNGNYTVTTAANDSGGDSR